MSRLPTLAVLVAAAAAGIVCTARLRGPGGEAVVDEVLDARWLTDLDQATRMARDSERPILAVFR